MQVSVKQMDVNKQKELDTLGYELQNLQKLHLDLEKQMLNFDEIVPFERQRTAEIYSPRLLNMMLVCGTHIESVTKLISRRCGFYYDNLRDSIRKINEKTVLSNLPIFSIPHEILFTPFTNNLEWWESYNELKHELQEKQFKITYTRVMDAFAALAALHCLAKTMVSVSNERIDQVLESKNWIRSESFVYRDKSYQLETWKSLLFKIDRICHI